MFQKRAVGAASVALEMSKVMYGGLHMNSHRLMDLPCRPYSTHAHYIYGLARITS